VFAICSYPVALLACRVCGHSKNVARISTVSRSWAVVIWTAFFQSR
jgi:hypothetical protein